MVHTPSTTLLSSGRKEYSATKITAYFSPKPSPVASSPAVQLQIAGTPVRGNERVAADMPVETRKRSIKAQAKDEGGINGVKKTEIPPPAVAPTPAPAQSHAHIANEPKTPSTPPISRKNVDKVVFGDLLFECSYTSRHVREIVGEKVAENKEMLDRLCVCPHCFKYTQEIVKYLGHRRVCSRRKEGEGGMVPGKKVYKHGEGWVVWEVDGEDEHLYCQNLSLCAKLFLGDKSVSFDVSSFIYYLLVHTDDDGSSQVVGFFSKEKQSWDLNNLACILIFPPWQRKGLGSILMGLSYSISRHEALIGGPEKPLSELGMRGYLKFWSAEIARWLLNEVNGGKTSLNEISSGTWILKEDCLEALRYMRLMDGSPDEGDVKIDLQTVREWVERTHANMLPTVDQDGWLAEFYCRERLGDDEDEEMEE